MIEGEVFVLEAVRNSLRNKLGYTNQQCECEYDEQIPAIAGDLYVAVIPAGIQPGPNHNFSGGVIDTIHSVQVMVLQRCGDVARDRRRNVFMSQLAGINKELSRIMLALDWQIDVLQMANQLLADELKSSYLFTEMLRASRLDMRPKMVNSETYGGSSKTLAGSTPYVAMARSVVFSGMRRIVTVQQGH